MNNTETAKAIVAKLEAEHLENVVLKEEAADFEQLLADTRSGLAPIPKPGEEWSEKASYITGDDVVRKGTAYIALKYNKNKAPELYPEYWEVKSAPSYPVWAETPDGTIIKEGEIYVDGGVLWRCIAQHTKSVVYKPKDGSSRWERV